MKVELDPNLVYEASQGSATALTTVLCACYPTMARIAVALSGDTGRGLGIVKNLVGQAMVAAPKWQDESAPDRWFMHHTILTLREHPAPAITTDPLLQYAAGKELPYTAFLRAIRKLPPQQIEAFVLSNGEGLDERKLAIAMDCSTTAARNHLSAANESLKLVTAAAFGDRMAEFKKAYENLTPDAGQVQMYISSRVRGYTVARTTGRTLKWLVYACVVGVIGFALWRAWLYMSS
jgi:DNA-directed RNA polymerase specialized sigma24 family protein